MPVLSKSSGRRSLRRGTDILRIFPGTRTVLSLVKRANRESARSPSLPVADWEFSKVHSGLSDSACRIIRRLNEAGVRGVAIPPGFPMDMTRWPGKVWEVSHKVVAEEAGVGQMGLNRIVIHPKFGNHIMLDTVLIDARLDRYDRPLTESPCIQCGLCISVCPVGAISKDAGVDFMSCAMHNYHELFGGFQEWIEGIVSSGDVRSYRSRFRDHETMSKWQSLTYGHYYRCSYCMAVCPAGEETAECVSRGQEGLRSAVCGAAQEQEGAGLCDQRHESGKDRDGEQGQGPSPCQEHDPALELPAIVAEGGVDVDALAFRKRYDFEVEANWKVACENFLECYHCPTAHPYLARVIDVDPDAYLLEISETFPSQHAPVREKPKGSGRPGAVRSSAASSISSGRTRS